MLTQKDILSNNISLTTISYPQNTKPYKTKLICFLFFIFSVLVPVQSICTPADGISIDTMFCNPEGGEEYEIGQDVLLSWNPDNALLFDPDSQVKVFLIRRRQNLTGYEDIVSLDPGNSTDYFLVQRSFNSMNFTVELGWLPTFNYSIPVKTHTFLFRVIPARFDDEPDGIYSSPSFEVIQPDPPSTATVSDAEKPLSTDSQPTPTVTVPSSSSLDSEQQSNSENKVLIVVIAVASLAAFLAFIAIVIAICGRKRNKNPTMLKSQSNLSTSSSAPLSMSKLDHDSESPMEADSIYSTTPLSNREDTRSKPKVSFSNENQPISASDVAFLSDAYRKVLRKPDWKPEGEDEEEDVNLSNEERLRRREATEIMKKELAEEGTNLQSLSGRYTKVEIHNHNIGDEPEKDGSSHSSESGSK